MMSGTALPPLSLRTPASKHWALLDHCNPIAESVVPSWLEHWVKSVPSYDWGVPCTYRPIGRCPSCLYQPPFLSFPHFTPDELHRFDYQRGGKGIVTGHVESTLSNRCGHG